MNGALLLMLVLALAVPGGRSPVARADQALEDWDRATLSSLARGGGDGSVYGAAALALLEGRFGDAEAAEGAADKLAPEEAQRVRALASQAAAFTHVLGKLAQAQTDGLQVFAPKGQLEVLAGLAQELATAHRATGLPGPEQGRVLVVFVAQEEDLAALAGLETVQVQNSGLRGLGRWGAVVLLSPSALPWGYDWQRVLAHELLHLGLHGRCGDAPLWFEEGYAHLADTFWRTGAPALAAEAERGLLALALKRKAQRSWPELERSFAAVAQPWEAAVAFAQAGAAVAQLVERGGPQSPAAVCALARRGVQFEVALARVWGGSYLWFKRVAEARWQKKLVRAEGQLARKKFGLDGADSEFLAGQLGDMLWGRGHGEAALATFQASAGTEPSPELAYRMALLLVKKGEPGAALQLTTRALEAWGPNAGLYLAGALAQEALEDPGAALALAELAHRQQPFSLKIARLRARLQAPAAAPQTTKGSTP
jgi:hypothetical protein